MFGNFLPGLGSGGSSGGGGQIVPSNLGSGGNSEIVHLENDKGVLVRYSALPWYASAEEVVNAAEAAGASEGLTDRLTRLSKHQLDMATNAVKRAKIRTKHSQKMMRLEQQWMQTMSQQGKAVSSHRLTTGETKANYSGYDAEMKLAENVINF